MTTDRRRATRSRTPRRAALGAGALAVVAGVVAGAALLLPGEGPAAPQAGPTSLETAALPLAESSAEVEPAAPEARFTRAVFAATTMPGSDPLLDRCQGPVAIDLGAEHPVLVAEHDYCGGSAWMPRLKAGEAVELSGPGIEPGRYVVGDIALGQRGSARMSDLPEAAVVLQTCISATQIVMVGLDRVETALAS